MTQAKRGRPQKSTSTLDAERILTCAKDLMKEEGKLPSIRKLAAALGVDAMAIYHYYDNKTALLEAVAASLMSQVCEPEDKGSWQEKIGVLSLNYVSLLQDYSGLLETFLSMETNSPANIFTLRFQAILEELGLPEEIEKDALDLLADYLHGYALAMNCNKQCSEQWDHNMMKGPLQLFCKSLETYC